MSSRDLSARLQWSTHRVLDAIHLLKVKVSVQHDRMVRRPRPTEEERDHSASSHSSSSDGEASQAQAQVYERTIGWQERLFSHEEVKKFRGSDNIGRTPEMSAQHAEKIREAIEQDPNYNGDVIYTRVVGDHYVDPSEIDLPFANPGEREPTDLAQAVLEGQGPEELVGIVHTNAQSLHFFASILSTSGSYHQQLLGIIRFYPSGRLEVRPRFSNKTNPETTYKFFTPANELIAYRFEICEDRVEQQSTFERTLIGDIKRRRAITEAAPSDCKLAQIPEELEAVRMFFRGEISTVKVFDWDSVAVDYQVKLPTGWTADRGYEKIVGSSQIAMCRRDGVAHINMPIEFSAVCMNQLAPMLEVCLHTYTSRRSRVVIGYGTCALPMQRGSHQITFDTWRVKGTVMDELRLQFLDAGLEIQPSIDIGVTAFMDSDEATVVKNKFGLRTIGSGSVTIKLNMAQQGGQFRKKRETMAPLSALGSLMPSRLATRASGLE
jgi:Meckel syndrome type 1 protein